TSQEAISRKGRIGGRAGCQRGRSPKVGRVLSLMPRFSRMRRRRGRCRCAPSACLQSRPASPDPGNDLLNVDPSTETLSGLKSSAKNLVNDGKAVVSSGKQLASVNANELQSGLTELLNPVENIPNAGSVQQGLRGVQTAAKSASQAWSSPAKNAGCP